MYEYSAYSINANWNGKRRSEMRLKKDGHLSKTILAGFWKDHYQTFWFYSYTNL